MADKTSNITNRILSETAAAAANAAVAAKSAADAAAQASQNASIAAKAAAESATAIAIVATDTSWMKKSLAGIETKLDEMDKCFVTALQHQEVLNNLSDHEKRIRRIEERIFVWIGAIGILSSIVTIAVSIGLKIIK